MQRPVQGAVSAAVESVPHGAAAAGRQRAGAGQGGERGVVAAAAGVGERHDGLGGADRADAAALDQPGNEVVDDGLQLGAVGLERAGGFAQGEGEAADLGVPDGLLAGGVARWPAPGQAGQAGLGERAAGELAVGVVPAQQQCPQPVGLRGAGGGEFLARAEQDPQRLAVAVRAGGGQPVGVQAQRGQHGQVRVDRVGLALPAAGLAVGLFALEHDQAGRGGGAGQADAVAAGALDRDRQPRTGGVVDDPGQQLGVAAAVVADRGDGDRGAVGEGDLDLVGVAVGVDTDDGVDEFCQHGHRPGSFLGSGSTVGTGLGRGHRVAHL